MSAKLVSFFFFISVLGSLGDCSPVASPLGGPLHVLASGSIRAYGVRALEVYTNRPTALKEDEKSVVIVQLMKPYRGRRGVAPLSLNLGTRWR